MKYFMKKVRLFCLLMPAMVPIACAPVVEKPPQNDFFEPVNRTAHRKAGSDTLVLTRKSDDDTAGGSLKDSLIVLFRQQERQLNDVIQQLNLIAKKSSERIPPDTTNIDDVLADRSTFSNAMLLEKIKNQSRRLNEVNAQLQLLAQHQQNQNGTIGQPPAGVNIVPVKPASSQQVPVLITDANTIPQKPSPKVPVQRSPNLSVNYGKALDLYKSQQYSKAIEVFEKLLQQKAEQKLADRYHFWMGVSYLNLNKSSQAIREFTRVLGYPHSEKLEETYFMIGQCYERTGAKNSAKAAYEKMLQLFPHGNLKQVAEKKLALLK